MGSNPQITEGIYLSNKISSIAEKITFEEEFCEPSPPQLGFHLPLPKLMFGNEYKPYMDIGLWEEIKRERFDHQKDTCEMCHSVCGRRDLVLHQRWKYEDIDDTNEMMVQFYSFDVLCLKCHDLVHFGRATLEDRLDATLEHLKEKANMTNEEALQDYMDAKEKYKQLIDKLKLNESVKIDNSRIFSIKALTDWLNEDNRRCVGRFGNLCCMSVYNPQLPKF